MVRIERPLDSCAVGWKAALEMGLFLRVLPMQSTTKGGVLTRRQFVAAGAAGSVAAVIGCNSGRQGNWEFLSDEQAGTLGAICDQIVPADDFPSATQAGVLDYIDKQLVRPYRRHQDAYRDGLQKSDASSRKRFGKGLAELAPAQQLEAVAGISNEQPEFFELVRTHTFQGYYGSPRHGGNRDAASWKMLGLTEPPLLGRAQYDLRKGAKS
jgi:gluconate 2-dehydrogenase gamma chain